MKSDRYGEGGVAEEPAPEWVNDLLPPQRHAEIEAEIAHLRSTIARLESEAAAIASMGRLLYSDGDALAETVRAVFANLGLDARPAEPDAPYDVIVDLGDSRRLLVVVGGSEGPVTKRSATVRQVFETAQSLTRDEDRPVLAANAHRQLPIAEREWLESASDDALMIVAGLGAVFVTTGALFHVWKLSLEDPQAARDHIVQIHEAAPGRYVFEATRAVSQ